MKRHERWILGLMCLAMLAGVSGCARLRFWNRGEDSLPPRLVRDDTSAAAQAYRLRPGDPVTISLRTPGPDQVETSLDEFGMIRLPLLGDPIAAEGMTSTELERAIERAYIHQGIYRQVTVNVVIPARSYFLQGEVRAPGRYPVVSGLTLRQAIAAAGGYTDFAQTRRIQLTRGGSVMQVNARQIERDPSRDIEIKTGDIIFVPRSAF